MAELLNIVDEKGNVFTIPPEQRALAEAHGFSAATEDDLLRYDRKKELSGPLGATAALTGSAANQLTFGAFNPLLEKFAPEKAETLRQTQEANPTASAIGSVGGFMGGVASPVVKGVQAIGGKVLGATGSKALQYGAESMALSAPSVAANLVKNEDYQEAGEMLLASGGMGAAIGALVRSGELGSNKLKEYTSPYTGKLSRYFSDRVEQSINNLESRTAGLERGSASKYSDAQIKERLDYARKKGLLDIVKSSSTRAEIATELKKEAGKQIGAVIKQVDDQALPLFDGVAARESAEALLEKSGKFGYADKGSRNAAKGILADLKQLTQKKVGDQIEEITPSIGEVQALKGKFAGLAYDEVGRRLKSPAAKVHAEAERMLDEQIGNAIGKAAELMPEAKDTWLNAKREYDLAGDLEKWTRSLVKRGSNKPVRLSDLGAMGVGGLTHGLPGAIAGWVTSGVTHEFGNATSAKLLRMSVSGAESANAAIRAATKRALDNTPVDALRVSSLGLLRTLAGTDDSHDAAQQIQEQMAAAQASPQFMQNVLGGVSGGFSGVNPQAAMAAQQGTIQAVSKLLELAPKRDNASPFESTAGRYTDSQVSDFERQLLTALNPFSVLDDLAQGTLDPGSMQILQTIYPNLYSRMQTELLSEAAAEKREYTAAQKLNLSMFLGANVDSLGSAASIRSLQQSFQKKDKKGNFRGGAKTKTSEGLTTQSQRIEQR